ncbi:glycosyltransferase family 2 protein [Pararobbsia silviterrae]|uniref:Glycosyltransferase family 2 protein n=1 Tax=Pararobbsia silviterrae TaxID=1792498 RepID=A0A494Y736_9BURK|nr:glycosyltransferase family A protein [Pararobbsia silviterrae]RKP58454.1 glycosyltransferase family 2 protein [Pararobbsia silviterrae]
MPSVVPFLSIVIPTHNRPALLERALNSIRSQRSALPCEIIVVSDAAHADNDAVCLRALGPEDIQVRRNGAPGPSASRNLGISLASGRYLMFLDDDDAWHPGFLARVAEMSALREDRFVYFDCSVVTENRAQPLPVAISERKLDLSAQLDERVFVKNQIHMSCLAFPRRLIGDTRFDAHMRAYEDWDFQLALYEKEWPRHVPIQASVVYEVNDESTDRRGSSQNANNFHAVMDYLYVYRRHPAPSANVREQRAELMRQVGISAPAEVF